MSTITNFLCWSPEVVASTIATEAATPSNAVLMATHTPLRIRIDATSLSAGPLPAEYVTERQLLDQFLNSPSREGICITPVLGASGSGKSHLVRWANVNIERRPGRHVIYLPKTTTLRDVVEALLMQRTGPVFDEIRGQLALLGDTVERGTLERKILNELAEAVRTTETTHFLTKPLVGDNGLSVLMHDPLFRAHLLRPGSFISRRAEHALSGRDPDAPDVPLEFTVDDLPLDIVDVANIKDAALTTQRLYGKLATNADMQMAAVALLNECLDLAVMRAANLGVGDIQRAFMKIREQLVGEEIILLIEDFALIQGVRRDLLDAIVEVGVVQGQEKYATVRTLMAVTEGYYNHTLPPTFRTRAKATSPTYIVDLDLTDQDNADPETLVDFFGRYLNAARVGKNRLEQTGTLINKCDGCPVRDECHSAFGSSREGFGLYPYNRPAILRAVRATAAKENPNLFSPRGVLSRAVRDVLTAQADNIKNGEFPGESFLKEERNSADLPAMSLEFRDALESEFSEPELSRYRTLNEFWGDAGTTLISPNVYAAFSMEPLSERFSARTQDPGDATKSEGGSTLTPTPTEFSKSLQKKLDDVAAWSNGKTMPQSVANEVRLIIREAIATRLDWMEPTIKDPDTPTIDKVIPKNARTVSIEGANESLALTIEPLVRIERTARNARFLLGLLKLKGGHSVGTGDAFAWLDSLSDSYTVAVKTRIIETLESTEEQLVDAAVSLIRGAALCGALPMKPKTVDYVNALLWQDKVDARRDLATRADQWREAERSYIALRADAVSKFKAATGVAQGNGAVHAIDDVKLRRIVKLAQAKLEDKEQNNLPSWCLQSEKKRQFLEKLVPLQLNSWRLLLTRVRSCVPAGESFLETVDAIGAAARDGRESGLVPVPDLGKVERDNDAARQLDFSSITRIEKLLQASASDLGLATLTAVGTDTGPDVAVIAKYLDDSARWIGEGLDMAEAKNRGSAVDIDMEITRVIEQWFTTVNGGL